MRLELYPDRGLKWTVSWCLTIPPATQMMLGSPGMSAMLYKNSTLLFFMQFTRNMQGMTGEAQSIVVPFVYDISRNNLQVPSRDSAFSSVPMFGLINQILARCSEYMHSSDCIIFNFIHEIMRNDLISA
jgi:hypothetical protein